VLYFLEGTFPALDVSGVFGGPDARAAKRGRLVMCRGRWGDVGIMELYDTIIIGGGFFGCSLAAHLQRPGQRTLVLERGGDLLLRASYANQARVHQGYHYPRNLTTGLRSAANFERFAKVYREAVVSDLVKLYAVARHNSTITAQQFWRFCEQIQAPIRPAAQHYKELFDRDLIEDVFLVREYAFDARVLRNALRSTLRAAGVEVELGVEVDRVRERAGGGIEVIGLDGQTWATATCYNCTYSQINTLLARSGLPTVGVKHEVAEIALCRPSPRLRNVGITVVDGPFFSLMPFPAEGLHSLSHVRYTPHHRLRVGSEDQDPYRFLEQRPFATNYPMMVRDASRYLAECGRLEYVRSLFEIKTVLLANEENDGRPILFRPDYGLSGFHVILGGKIDNVFDMLQAVDARRAQCAGAEP
jgi:glycine/D-amino acid oxidase-like deaminating enzyme